jgi:hypothetical protein
MDAAVVFEQKEGHLDEFVGFAGVVAVACEVRVV